MEDARDVQGCKIGPAHVLAGGHLRIVIAMCIAMSWMEFIRGGFFSRELT